ncbi:hypothetical protein EDD22DRAFT_960572 [Suillus occidentalis]|nr:hypothetical protein EDD22DRAFT_960572 [Suillus occidentalis]
MGTTARAPHLFETVRSCKALKRLQCPPAGLSSTSPLSLPSSICRSIKKAFQVPRPNWTHNLSFATFLNVTTLRFCYAPIADITAVMQHSEFPELKEFELVAHVLPEAELWPLLRALLQCKACHTLENIAISDDDPEVEEPPGNSFSVVGELLCFTQLRSLQLFIHCSINLDNNFFWTPSQVGHSSTVSLRQCPQLHALNVELDVVNIDIDPKAESFQHISLINLGVRVHDPPAADTEAIARIIFAMLPNLLPTLIIRAYLRRSYLPPSPTRRLQGHVLPPHNASLTVARWIDEYGPLITIRSGFQAIVIIGRYKAVVEIMEKHGKLVAGQPSLAAGEILERGLSIVLSHAGDRFRRFPRALHPHLQHKSAEAYQPMQMSQAKTMILSILHDPGHFQDNAGTYAAATIMKVAYGKNTPTSATDPEIREARQLIRDFRTILRRGHYLVDLISWLKYLLGYAPELQDQADVYRPAETRETANGTAMRTSALRLQNIWASVWLDSDRDGESDVLQDITCRIVTALGPSLEIQKQGGGGD